MTADRSPVPRGALMDAASAEPPYVEAPSGPMPGDVFRPPFEDVPQPVEVAERFRDIARRIHELDVWVHTPLFQHTRRRGTIADANREVARLREDLHILAFREWQDDKDAQDWLDSVNWVRADLGETEQELMMTLSRIIPMRPGESNRDYAERLRKFRQYVADRP